MPPDVTDVGATAIHAATVDVSRAPRFWERLTWAIWVGVVAGLCARSFFSPHTHSVYPYFAEAGRNWIEQSDCYGAANAQYRYSPLVSALFVPLSFLPDSLGGTLWRLLSAVALLAAFAWYLATVCRMEHHRRWAPLLLLLPLSVESVNNGQANILVAAALLASGAAVARRRWNSAAVFFTIAALFKVYPLALALLLVVAYPRQLAWRLAAALLLGLSLPFLLQNPEFVAGQYARWLDRLVSDHRFDLPLRSTYRDAYLLFRFFVAPMPALVYRAVQLVTASFLALAAWRSMRQRWPDARRVRILFDLGCCWMIVFGPATESSTFALLAAPLACALSEAWQSEREPVRRIVLTGILLFFVAGLLNRQLFGAESVAFILQPLAALTFFVERSTCLLPEQAASAWKKWITAWKPSFRY